MLSLKRGANSRKSYFLKKSPFWLPFWSRFGSIFVIKRLWELSWGSLGLSWALSDSLGAPLGLSWGPQSPRMGAKIALKSSTGARWEPGGYPHELQGYPPRPKSSPKARKFD